ncbi:MAG: hypothetical protein ACTSU7_09875 [Candidatus Heimdallarchaeaceae archaeon]
MGSKTILGLVALLGIGATCYLGDISNPKPLRDRKIVESTLEQKLTTADVQRYLGIPADDIAGNQTLNASYVFLQYYKQDLGGSVEVTDEIDNSTAILTDIRAAISDANARGFEYKGALTRSVEVSGKQIQIYIPHSIKADETFTVRQKLGVTLGEPSSDDIAKVMGKSAHEQSAAIVNFVEQYKNHYVIQSIAHQLEGENNFKYMKNVMLFARKNILPTESYYSIHNPILLLRNQRGDCSEYTILHASLAAAKGIDYSVGFAMPPTAHFDNKQSGGTVFSHVVTGVSISNKFSGIRLPNNHLLIDNDADQPGRKGASRMIPRSWNFQVVSPSEIR